MQRSRKTVIIVTAVLAAAGLVSAVTGTAMKKRVSSAEYKDAGRIDASDIGKSYSVKLDTEYLFEGGQDLYCYQIGYDDDSFITIPVRGYKSDNSVNSSSYSSANGHMTVNVKATPEGTGKAIADHYDKDYEEKLIKLKKLKEDGIPEGSNLTMEKLDFAIEIYEEAASDEGYKTNLESVTAYEFEVVDVRLYNILTAAGWLAAIPMLIILAYALLGMRFKARHLVLGTCAAILIAAVCLALIARKDISTMLSLKEYAPGIYTMRIDSDYKLDKILEDGPYDENSVARWVSENMFWNIPIGLDISDFGCCSFACTDPSGNHLFGRNYDYKRTDALIFYTEPENGYASIAVTDLAIVNMAGDSKRHEPDSLYGRAFLRAAPLLTSDGINEAGLGVSMLSLDYTDMSQNTGKTPLYLPVAQRAILEKCASVDEAIALLGNYDIKTMVGRSFHIFITDKTGRSVVAEWIDGELKIVESKQVTNFFMSAPEREQCDRYDTIVKRLADKNGVLNSGEAMTLLMDASQNYKTNKTEWSCVYDLDNFKLYFVSDRDTSNVIEVTRETFK